MKKTLKISGLIVGAMLLILLFMLLTPMIFREKFAEIIKRTANRELKTEMNFSELDVTFFRHFPNLTVSLADFSLRSSPPFSQDTLVSARDVSFGINLGSLLGGPIRISRVYVNRGRVVMQYNEQGASNFEVYQAEADTMPAADTSGSKPVAIQIDHIIFIKTDFIYADPSIPLKLVVHGINYHGESKFGNDILRLTSRVNIDSLDVYYDQIRYLKSKPVKANLSTSINMNSLDMKFEKNNLYIKDIPFEFKGEFNFRKDGYSLFLSLFSMFGKEYFSGSVYLVSEKNLWVSAKADISLDLQTWTRLLGVTDYDLRGFLSMKLNAQGDYITSFSTSARKPEPVILSIPNFTFRSRLTDGYLRIGGLPQAIRDISFDLSASCTDHDYNSISLRLENLKAGFLKNRLEGYCRIDRFRDLPMDAHLSVQANLAELREVIPLDSTDIQGVLEIAANLKGNYAPEKHMFPVASVNLDLRNGYLQTKYSPKPIENLTVSAEVTNSDGKLSDTRVRVDSLVFTFGGNPFRMKAGLSNPENVAYDITAAGDIDVAGIYQLFSREGMDLSGFISMDLRLKGRQSDALEGHIGKLYNSGRLEFRDIAFTSGYLPLPLIVKEGLFRFENDDIRFSRFKSEYGESDLTLDGHLSNVVNYILSDGEKLKGSFAFHSQFLKLDEFMPERADTLNSGRQSADSSVRAVEGGPEVTGVFVVPPNLEIEFQADVKKASYGELEFRDLDADMEVKDGMILLKAMQFNLIGCHVAMDATYGSLSPVKAFFEFHVKADSFDVQRAFRDIELFRNLSPSAAKCEGIISIDYSMKGRLDERMEPIYPSLDGSGVVRLENVKVMGMKLFTTMGRNLEKDELKNPDLSRIEIRTSVKKNVITLERTKMKIAGFRFRISGEANFYRQLNLKARLGLPPLGIVGVPMRILGTMENPKFKYGRGLKDEDVEETDYYDEISPEMLKLIRDAKATDLQDEPD